MKESDADLLSPEARDEFCLRMANWDDEFDDQAAGGQGRKGRSLMSFVFGGSSGSLDQSKNAPVQEGCVKSIHGKEDYLLWDELASSEDEDEYNSSDTEYSPFPSERSPTKNWSIGASFEHQLAYESSLSKDEVGITGLERMPTLDSGSKSLRARVRHRLSQLVDFYGLVAESRYLSEEGISDTLNA